MKRLIVIQNKPTQFDVPFYSLATQQGAFALKVYYTEGQNDTSRQLDPETGQIPVWDNLLQHSYSKTFLSPEEVADPRRVCKGILLEEPDLVIVSGYSPLLHARLAWTLKKNGVRIGLRSDNTLHHSNFKGIKGFVKRLVLPYWLKQYDTWHPVGTLAAEYLMRNAKDHRPIHFFPYSPDNAWFTDLSEMHKQNRNAIRREFGFQPDDFVVLGIMKWHEREDPLTLIESLCRINCKTSLVKLILVGDGPLRSEVKRAAGELKDSVCMPGYLPYSALPKYYAISDLFVHPALGEPWGVSVNEAMACGVPVLAARGVGAGRDLIIEGKTGYAFPDGDSDALAERILMLSNDRIRLSSMGEAARQQANEWGYELTMREMMKALEI